MSLKFSQNLSHVPIIVKTVAAVAVTVIIVTATLTVIPTAIIPSRMAIKIVTIPERLKRTTDRTIRLTVLMKTTAMVIVTAHAKILAIINVKTLAAKIAMVIVVIKSKVPKSKQKLKSLLKTYQLPTPTYQSNAQPTVSRVINSAVVAIASHKKKRQHHPRLQ